MGMDFSYNDVLEHVDLNNMLLASKGWGVVSGLAVSERGAGANMSVDVALGEAYIDNTYYTESGTTNVVITTADATHARKDLIVYDTATSAPIAIAGTPAATPQPPDITANDILLAMVNVAANDTAINTSEIVDKRIFVSPAGFIIDGSQVYNTTAPTSWTDLDLSSYVGSRQAVVFLKVKNAGVSGYWVAFRKNGETDEFYGVSTNSHCAFCALDASDAGYVTVITDTSGVIEMFASNNLETDIWLEGYWLTL